MARFVLSPSGSISGLIAKTFCIPPTSFPRPTYLVEILFTLSSATAFIVSSSFPNAAPNFLVEASPYLKYSPKLSFPFSRPVENLPTLVCMVFISVEN